MEPITLAKNETLSYIYFIFTDSRLSTTFANVDSEYIDKISTNKYHQHNKRYKIK